MHYVTKFDDVNKAAFELFQMTPENVCKPIHDIINYSTFICPFEPGKLGKQGKKNKDLNISRTNKALLLK